MSTDAVAADLAAPGGDRRILLPIDEVMELTGLSESMLRRNAPIRRVGKRTLIPRAWLDDLAAWPEREVAPIPPQRPSGACSAGDSRVLAGSSTSATAGR